ncbi:MAG: hypothetical protein JWO60_2095, partial [Frankiales bacterium]|nr:hypothetical protein [Frankiales bacterium]
GALVAVLGQLDAEQAAQLARLRTGTSTCIAVLIDTDSWAPVSPRARETAAAAHAAARSVLAATGWRVLSVEHGTTLASVWPLVGNRGPSHTDRAPAAPSSPVASSSGVLR